MTESDIAVNVIGGYLGAGKTTLVNYILRTADQRIVVLVNDFGEINIDSELIASQDGDTISLANGCICCSLIGGFAAALETIHVGSGDIVVMNKIDLVSREQANETRSWLKDQAPNAVIVSAANAEVDAALLFGVLDARVPAQADNYDQHGAGLFESWSWTSSEPLERGAVERMMRAAPDQVVRTKGLLVLSDQPHELVALQAVGRRWSLRQIGAQTNTPTSKIVMIGFHGAIGDDWINQQLS